HPGKGSEREVLFPLKQHCRGSWAWHRLLLLAPRTVVISGRTAPCNKLSTRNGGANLQPKAVPHLTGEDFLASSPILLGRCMDRGVRSNIQPDRGRITVLRDISSHQRPPKVSFLLGPESCHVGGSP